MSIQTNPLEEKNRYRLSPPSRQGRIVHFDEIRKDKTTRQVSALLEMIVTNVTEDIEHKKQISNKLDNLYVQTQRLQTKTEMTVERLKINSEKQIDQALKNLNNVRAIRERLEKQKAPNQSRSNALLITTAISLACFSALLLKFYYKYR